MHREQALYIVVQVLTLRNIWKNGGDCLTTLTLTAVRTAEGGGRGGGWGECVSVFNYVRMLHHRLYVYMYYYVNDFVVMATNQKKAVGKYISRRAEWHKI